MRSMDFRKAVSSCPCWILLIVVGAVLYFTGYFHQINTKGDNLLPPVQTQPPIDEIPFSADKTHISISLERGDGQPTMSKKALGSNITTPNLVYLFAYYRSGSTLLGEFFNQNNDAFYWFEPLAGINESLAESYTHVNPDGSLKVLNETMLNTFEKTIESILTCDLQSVPISVYKHRFMTTKSWLKSKKMQKYFECFKSNKGSRNYMQPMTGCRHYLEENCKSSLVRVVKDIRLPMSVLEKMFQNRSDVKVIYQTRDPRGQLNSLWPATSKAPNLPLDARFLCKHVMSDYKKYLDLNEKYPGRILWFRYEDIVKDPGNLLKIVYEFVGLNVPEYLKKWLLASMHADKDGNAIDTRRKNATQTAYKWKQKLTSKQIKLINDECKELIDILGYTL